MPEPVRTAVLDRVRRTGAQTERLLRAASALGSVFNPATLAPMLGLSPQDVAYHCERGLDARLLVPADAEYRFANALIRDVLYMTTPAPTRDVYHRHAAELRGRRTVATSG